MQKQPKMLGVIEPNRVYLAAITPPAARDLFFVSTYDKPDPASNAHNKHGYQRPPTESRFPEIARYFAEGDNSLRIPPVIVSVRLEKPAEIERFLTLLETGDTAAIKQVFGPSVASVVDGQHRYKGLVYQWEKDEAFLPAIPIMLNFGLSFIDEAEYFSTINATQRKLPKALIETNRGDITKADRGDFAQKIRRITFALCREADSVWGPRDGIEQINMTGVRDPDRPVTYEGLRRSTANMFPEELLSRLEGIDADLPAKLAKRYWRLVSEACKEAWNGIPDTKQETDEVTGEVVTRTVKYRIKDLVGVAALAKLGKDIITSQIDSGDKSRMEDLVDKLSHVDWEKREGNPWMASQAGFAGQKDLYHMLHKHVYRDESPAGAAAYAAGDGDEDEI
jgi:DGQHR domain-containing protein